MSLWRPKFFQNVRIILKYIGMCELDSIEKKVIKFPVSSKRDYFMNGEIIDFSAISSD
jgi:hypothetical protein